VTRLVRLEVGGFRGIVDATLPFDGRSVVLGGGNGTGKTAFVDALEFLYTGSVSALTGTAGLGLRQHGPHIHAEPSTSFVRAVFEEPSASVTRWLAGPVDCPVSLERHLRTGSKLTFILRRSQLQAFIHARPADRYRSMADLIGLERLDGLQALTKRALDRIDRDHEEAARELAQLASLEPPVPVDDDEILREMNSRLADAGLDEMVLSSLDDISRVRGAVVRRAESRRPQDPTAIARASLLDTLRRGTHDRLRDALAAYVSLAPSASDRKDRTEMLEVLGVLTRGRELLRHTPDAIHCPLCESEINARAVLASLIRRVGQLEEVGLLQQQLDRAREDLDASLVDVSARLRVIQALAAEAGVSTGTTETFANSVAMLRDSIRGGAQTETLQMAGRLEAVLDRWALWVRETTERLHAPRNVDATSDADDETDALTGALSLLEGAAVQRATASRARAERERLASRRAELEATLARSRATLSIASTVNATLTRVRNEELQAVFDDLQSDLVHFYEALHPGEGQRALAIAMDPKKRGSADLRLDFFDRSDQDPRAFASEGHLDSLGLCIFLAFVRRFSGDWPLLVLDDVVATVDAAHKARVARLLFEEFGDRQLLITTHDSRWFSELRRVQDELGIEGSHNVVIEKWSLEEGPTMRPAATTS
jgi:recombinational DNA repair ATPase RecF